MSMEYTILNQVKELDDGTVTVPLSASPERTM